MKSDVRTDPASAAFGRRTMLMAMAPSSSGGMNSEPSSGTSDRAAISSSAAMPRVSLLRAIALSSSAR